MSKLVFNRNGGSADEYGHLLALNRLLIGDVVEGMLVAAAGSPNMTVLVQPGSARVTTGTYPSSYGYFVGIDTALPGESVTITTSNPSNPRHDLIVAYVDKSVTPSTSSANNPNNMLKVAAVAGTPNASPVDPTGSAIQSAVGASNPYIIIARVIVNAAVTSITSPNVIDLRSFLLTRGSPYKFSVYRTGAWTMPAAAFVQVLFDTEEYDTGSNYDNTTNYCFTAPVAGYYRFYAAVSGQGIGSSAYLAVLFKNGSAYKNGSQFTMPASNDFTSVVAPPQMLLAAGDVIEIFVYNGNGSPQAGRVGVTETYFGGELVSVS